MRAVAREQDQDNEIGHQQRDVECVRVVETPESRVQKMLADIWTQSLWARPKPRGTELKIRSAIKWKSDQSNILPDFDTFRWKVAAADRFSALTPQLQENGMPRC